MKNSGTDPYCYPGTNVLRNLKDIRNAAELDAFESGNAALRLFELAEKPITGSFDLARLRETHHHIFQDVYLWAGEFREGTGTMTKQRATGAVITYADSAYIEPALQELSRKLTAEKELRSLPMAAFASRAAYFYGEFDAVHPFREGNSRTLRQFFRDMAHSAGYALSWQSISHTEAGRNSLFLARDLAVLRGDSSALVKISEACLRPA